MVDWQNPVTIFSDLGVSASVALGVVISVVHSLSPPLIRWHWQMLRSRSYTSSTESICASPFVRVLLRWLDTFAQPMLVGSSFAISALSMVYFAAAAFGDGRQP